jgi:hypothetical protein
MNGCEVSGNGTGLDCWMFDGTTGDFGFILDQCTVSDNVGDAMTGWAAGSFMVVEFELTNTTVNNNGGDGAEIYQGWVIATNCEFRNNGGDAIAIEGFGSATLDQVVISDNGGGIYASGYDLRPGGVGLQSSTYHNNESGIYLGPGEVGEILIVNSIISDTHSASPPCSPIADVSCSVIFGNAGGDEACAAQGPDNVVADPLYCDEETGNLFLAAESPAAPGNSPGTCGLIGALPVACSTTSIPSSGTPPALAGRLWVAPNPIVRSGELRWPSSSGTEVRLYDVAGRLIASQRAIAVAGAELSISWSSLVGGRDIAPGVYYATIGDSDLRARVVVVR